MILSPCFKGRKEPKRKTKKTKKARGVRRERKGDEKVEGGSAKEKKEKRKEGGKRCPHPHVFGMSLCLKKPTITVGR